MIKIVLGLSAGLLTGCGSQTATDAGAPERPEEMVSASASAASASTPARRAKVEEIMKQWGQAHRTIQAAKDASEGTELDIVGIVCGMRDGGIDEDNPKVIWAATMIGESFPPVCLGPKIEIENTPDVVAAGRLYDSYVRISGVKRGDQVRDVIAEPY